MNIQEPILLAFGVVDGRLILLRLSQTTAWRGDCAAFALQGRSSQWRTRDESCDMTRSGPCLQHEEKNPGVRLHDWYMDGIDGWMALRRLSRLSRLRGGGWSASWWCPNHYLRNHLFLRQNVTFRHQPRCQKNEGSRVMSKFLYNTKKCAGLFKFKRI